LLWAVALVASVGMTVVASAADSSEIYCVKIEAFVRPGSPQSDAAAKFLESLAARRPGIALDIHDVSKDSDAEARVRGLFAEHKVAKPGLPVVAACRQLVVGYRDDETTGRRIEDLLTIEAFVRDGCPHCAAAERFLNRRMAAYRGFKVTYHEITRDAGARDRLFNLANSFKVQAASVPAFHVCGRLIVGYVTDETSGRDLEAVLREACVPCPREKPKSAPATPSARADAAVTPAGLILLWASLGTTSGADREPARTETTAAEFEDAPLSDLPPDEAQETSTAPSTSPPSQAIDLPLFGHVDAAEVGLPLFTLAVGLVDGFNPCAMWVLLFLLSILVNLKSRTKILAVAGTFVVISGLAYFAFMAAWLNVFLLVGYLRWVQVTLGLLAVFVGAVHVKDYFAFHKGISFSIPESAKPGIYARVRRIVTAENLTGAIVGASVLAVLVNIVELLCTAGLPALYTQVLTMRQLPAWQNYAYLTLYIAAYMADDTLAVTLATVTLGKHKMQEREGRWLKLVSGVVVLALGVVLLFKPEWLI
jgi:glutaredoxin